MKEFKPEDVINDLEIEKIKLLPDDYYSTKSVLGIDIYRYSEYELELQTYIPVLFNGLFDATVKTCLKKEKYIFQYYKDEKDFKEQFISTGDGGFQVFENPLEAFVFAVYLQLHLKRYNSGGLVSGILKKLRDFVGKIEMRYAISYDKLIKYDKNYFGPAIIDNSRLLSKDRLNRLLIFENVFDWFENEFNSIENLSVIKTDDIKKINIFKNYEINNSLIFDKGGAIKSVDILKIGSISSKNKELKVYNLHVQVGLLSVVKADKYNFFLVTLGNLNTAGIE